MKALGSGLGAWPLVIGINGFYGRGGTERQIVDIALGFRSRGRAVTVLSRWPLDRRDENYVALREGGVKVLSRGVGDQPSPLQRLRTRAQLVASRGRDDAYEAYAWRWQARQLRKRAGSPVIVHEIPYFGQVPRPGRLILSNLCLPTVQTILGTPSEPVLPATPWTVMTSDGAPRLPERWAYEWIPCTTDAPAPRTSVCPEADRLRLLFVGRLEASKGVDVLLDATADLPGVSLTVVGDGSEAATLRCLAAGRADVIFAGSLGRNAIFEEMQRADVIVVPSVPTDFGEEGMPTVIAEALSQGRPVVASAVGGVPRLLQASDAPGWLVDPGNARALRERLSALTPGEITGRAERARATYDRLIRLDAVLDAYERAYARAIQRAASAERAGHQTRGLGSGPGTPWLSEIET